MAPEGTVKWFDNRKGYGFIQSEEHAEDIFVHYSAVEMEGFKTLEEGEKVAFEVLKSDKGYRAQNVRKIV
ncbi:MAG: cold-shock protein [Planctomycetota bacterium]